MYWFLALSLHLWPFWPDAFLYLTVGCSFPLETFGCGWDAGIVDGHRVWDFGGSR